MRQRLLAALLLGAMVSGQGTFTQGAFAQTKPLYPDISDNAHATPGVVALFKAFFVPKSAHDAPALMTKFNKTDVYYVDATSGGLWPNWDSLDAIFNRMLPKVPPEALSYPVRIYGDERSAMVAFTDTPELFGRELRILGSVSFDAEGKVIRWVDYWDGRSSNVKNTLKPTYPTDFHDSVGNATGRIAATSAKLQQAFAAGDAAGAAAMFHNDGVFEDMALHNQILGRAAIQRYLTRVLPAAPYGKGAAMAHVVGNDLGGGYEWAASADLPMKRGNTAVELDPAGEILRFTIVYDSSLMADTDYRDLVLLSAEK